MIFNIPIEGWSWEKVRVRIDHPVRSPCVWLVTANPEILLEARRDPSYAQVLKQADARLVDGFGLWLMLYLRGEKTSRVTGADLSEALVQLAAERGWRVALVGGMPGVAEAAAETIAGRFPSLVVMAEHGGHVHRDGQDDEAGDEARHRVTLFAPHLLLVAFGHPKQERWIARHLSEFPSVKVVMGVGGTFDFWSGSVKRAPTLFRQFGLEWLWRLIHDPKRFRRMWNAIIMFPLYYILE